MSPKLGRILYGEANAQVSAAQQKMFEKAGYVVVTALGRAAIEDAVKQSAFGLIILGHTLTRDDRHHLPYMAKKANPGTKVLVLHASGKHPKVDIALDSRDGERVVLTAVAKLLTGQEASRVAQPIAAVA
jgi:DNA-binding NtrC family response regulator